MRAQARSNFSNFGSLKSTETVEIEARVARTLNFSNFGSLKSTETLSVARRRRRGRYFSNFGSLKSTETPDLFEIALLEEEFQQFRLVEEH